MISVCIATYNGELFIKEQLESILVQLGAEDEVIVSDDASTDRTVEIVELINDSRVRVLHHQPKRITDNFENALKAARGDYIYLADQDDIWVSGRVAAVQARLESGVALVTVDAKIINAKGEVIEESFFKVNGSRPGFLKNVIKNSFLGCCMAFRREVLDYVLPFAPYLYMHDWYIGLVVIARSLPYEFMPVAYHLYRKHEGNVTESGRKSNNPLWLRLKNRMTLLAPLLCSLIVTYISELADYHKEDCR